MIEKNDLYHTIHDVKVKNIYIDREVNDDLEKNTFVLKNVECNALHISNDINIQIEDTCKIKTIIMCSDCINLDLKCNIDLLISSENIIEISKAKYYFNRKVPSNNTIVPIAYDGCYIFPKHNIFVNLGLSYLDDDHINELKQKMTQLYISIL